VTGSEQLGRPVRVVSGLSAHRNKLDPVPLDGRPRFAKRSFGNVKQVKIAAIDPDFDSGIRLGP
jgi:hypothetical protein